ncbi:MAG: hypothetical protein JRH01_22965 [Deltaproteobacteria bacterium]|nr:hypothetical protein [Deltaproteobacteria bacterium]MBW2393965.1 hypothetical protein [Deltaproteobacteria bacterium]
MSDSQSAERPRTRLAALFLLTLILGAADCDSSSDTGRRSRSTFATTQAVLVSEEMMIEQPAPVPGPGPAVPEPGAALVFGLGTLISLRVLRRRPIR